MKSRHQTVIDYAVRKLGVTEADIRYYDSDTGDIVLWNRRRIPLNLSELP